MPRSDIIWTKSLELSLKLRYQRTQRTIISWSKCRPLKGSTLRRVGIHRLCQAALTSCRFAPEPRIAQIGNPGCRTYRFATHAETEHRTVSDLANVSR